MFYDDFLIYVSYRYYLRFSCQRGTFKTGIHIIFYVMNKLLTTFRNLNKARQLIKNPKAGISVTLTGIAEVITDRTILHEF